MPAPPLDAALSRLCCVAQPCSCPKALASILSDKYIHLVRWRRSHDALCRNATPMHVPGARRARQQTLAKLSAIYPGALRELERLTAPHLEWRAVKAAHVGGCAPVWLRLVWDYHALWHRGLAYRRFCAHMPQRSRPTAPELAERFACWYERAARHTPWGYETWPAHGLELPQATPRPRLKDAVTASLERRYGLDGRAQAWALWSNTTFGAPKPEG